jgi:hypothetical protein
MIVNFCHIKGTPTMGTTSLGLGLGLGPPPGATGNNQTSSFGGMDQYVDFGTANALDLATGSKHSNTMNSNYSTNGLGGSMLGLVEEPTSMTVDANAGRGYALQMSPSQASRQQPQPQPQSQPSSSSKLARECSLEGYEHKWCGSWNPAFLYAVWTNERVEPSTQFEWRAICRCSF